MHKDGVNGPNSSWERIDFSMAKGAHDAKGLLSILRVKVRQPSLTRVIPFRCLFSPSLPPSLLSSLLRSFFHSLSRLALSSESPSFIINFYEYDTARHAPLLSTLLPFLLHLSFICYQFFFYELRTMFVFRQLQFNVNSHLCNFISLKTLLQTSCFCRIRPCFFKPINFFLN